MHYTQEDAPPGRDDYWRDNAVTLLEERDILIARLRQEVTKLLQSKRALRAEIKRLQEMLP